MRTLPLMTCGFLIQLVFCNKNKNKNKQKTMWFICVEVELETSAPPPKKSPGSAPATSGEKRQTCEPALRLNCKTILKRNYMNHTINKHGKDGAECTIAS